MEVQWYNPRMSEACAWEWQLLHKTCRNLHKVPSTKSGPDKYDQTLTAKKPVSDPSQPVKKGTVSVIINLMSTVHRGGLDT